MLAPLVVSGGTILALKGSKAAEEIAESKPLLKKLKLASFEIVTAGDNLLVEPTTIVRVALL
jgi:16S rRNA (guanine527-N7)-methyltransferase